jgi:hypothetical protein
MSISDHKAMAARAEAARTELGIAASSSERRNRPRILVILAGLAFVGACIYSVIQFQARAEAFGKLKEQRERRDQITRLADEIDNLRKKESARGLVPDARVAPKLEMLATGVNFKLSGPVSDSEAARTGTMVQKKYSARAANQDPAAMLNFLQASQGGDTPGLEISRLSIRPQGPEGSYTVDIDFTRWEKIK